MSWDEFEEIAKNLNNEKELEKRNIGIDFAAKLIKARQKLNLTQAELAKRAGLDQSAIARIENTGSLPRIDTVYKIANGLESEFDFYSKNTLEKAENALMLETLNKRISNLELIIKKLTKEINLLRCKPKQNISEKRDLTFSALGTPFKSERTEFQGSNLFDTKGVEKDYEKWYQ